MSGVRPSQRPPFFLIYLQPSYLRRRASSKISLALKRVFRILAVGVLLRRTAGMTKENDMCYLKEVRFLILILLLLPFSVHAQEQKEKPYRLNFEVWVPPEFLKSDRKWPLIAFSHGFGGCAVQSAFLMQHLADHGYIVVAPDHADARCGRSGSTADKLRAMREGRERPEVAFRFPEQWTDQTDKDRRDDILSAIASMMEDRQYKNYIDTDRMGLIGHSLGGYTVLGMAGAWPSWKDKRFKAVLALSPYVEPFLLNRGLENIDVPVMYQTGTRDYIAPSLKRAGGAYAQTRAPKYLIEFDNANHFAWTELDKDYQAVIDATALAFFDKYLMGEEGRILLEGAQSRQIRTYLKEEAR
jgi:predicted dienelactone hydrolase